jgi:predicted type IV restriction endonuclease
VAQVTSDTGGEIILSFPDASFKIQRHMTYMYLESNDTTEILVKHIITISESNIESEVHRYCPKCGSS